MEKLRSLSVVVPVYNEEAVLEELVRRCMTACAGVGLPFEIVLVDDGSTDHSRELIERAVRQSHGHVVGVMLNRNYGQHAAVMAGFDRVTGDAVVTLDADLQNPPEEIPAVLERLMDGADVVGTMRVPRCDSWFRRVCSFVVNKAVQKATGVMMHDYGCMLRGYRRHIVQAMLKCHERSTFIPILANSFARTTAELAVRHEPRTAGESKYGLWKLINLQFDLLTGITTFPLRVLSLVGAAISALGVGFGTYLLVMRVLHGPEWAVSGVFTLFAVLFILVGAQFMGLGLMGEYLGRVYHDVRARPRYFVQEVIHVTADSTNRSRSEDATHKESPQPAVAAAAGAPSARPKRSGRPVWVHS